mgnify:CR=1 FL=1
MPNTPTHHAKAERNTSTRHEAPGKPGVGVRVWYGRAFVDGPDCSLRGWFWCVFDEQGEGDATGPYNGKTGRAEATADATAILHTL